VRQDVERPVRTVARPEGVGVRADLDEVDLLDTGIAVAPLGADRGGTLVGLQI
jgi:hypothetical protein